MHYRFGDFVLDTENYQLTQRDKAIDLRAKAFHVLTFLLKNRHRMVSKDELLDEVWHKQFIAEATLNSCIKTVRQALGDDGKNQNIIQTVRGRGYRFVSPVELVKSEHAARGTISSRLGERFDKKFVGREQELGLIMDAVAQPVLPYWICYLFGPGGIGKTSILKKLCRKLAAEHFVVYIDCRELEPTPEAFINDLAALIFNTSGGIAEDKDHTLKNLTQLLGERGGNAVLCFDQFESFNVLESWLRQTFFPALPETVLTVIASRQAPKTAWYTNSDWASGFQMLEIGDLPEQDADAMLASRDLSGEQIKQVRKFAKGYPLALELAAMLYRTQPGFQFSANLAPIELVTKLSTSALSGLPDVEREAVEALSTVHRANEPILRALLGLKDAQQLFNKLRELPFVHYSTYGIALHDVVRDAIEKDLSYRDPVRSSQYRKRAWAYFRDEANQVPRQRLWRLTADLLFLIEAPVIRDTYFPAGSGEYTIQHVEEQDTDEVIAISRSAEPGAASAITEKWLTRHPEHFYIAKTQDNKIAGFAVFFSPETVDQDLLQEDPVTAAWLEHLRQKPIDANETALFYRRWITRNIGDGPSPAQGAFFVDIKRAYMEMRPSLRRLYMLITHLDEFLPVLKSLGFKVIEQCKVNIGSLGYHTVLLDFGEQSIDGWLIRLVKNQLDQ